MNLKSRINNKDFTVKTVQGNVISTEFNETLDGANIIIQDVPKQNFKPFDDVYLYEGRWFSTQSRLKSVTEIPSKFSSVDVYSGFGATQETDVYISATTNEAIVRRLGDWERFYTDFTDLNEQQALTQVATSFDSYTGKPNNITLRFGLKVGSSATVQYYNVPAVFRHGVINETGDTRIVFNLIPMTWSVIGYYSKKTKTMTFKLKETIYSNLTLNSVEIYNPFLKRTQTVRKQYTWGISKSAHYYLVEDGLDDWNVTLHIKYREIANKQNKYEKNVKMRSIVSVDEEELVFEFRQGLVSRQLTFTKTNQDYSNSTFQNAIRFPNERDLFDSMIYEIYEMSFVFEKEQTKEIVERTDFYNHFLVQNVVEEEMFHNDDNKLGKYKYTIDLMSETKGLENKVLPNSSITQPLVVDKKKSVWFYLQKYVRLYSPKRKVVTNEIEQTWKYMPKYELDPKLEEVFGNIYCPDFSFTQPTLRDVLTQLMLVKDCIPVVKDNIISYMDISKTIGLFDYNSGKISGVQKLQSADTFSQNLVKQYSNAISQDNNARIIEKSGFRNNEVGTMKLEDLAVETRFPIYKINKVLLCYYKRAYRLVNGSSNNREEITFLCKQDITSLVLLENERNLLYKDWKEYHEENIPTTMQEFSQYRFSTVGYNRGSNKITGWGTLYDRPIGVTGWWKETVSYLENIMNFIDWKEPYGINTFAYLKEQDNDYIVGYVSNAGLGDWKKSMIDFKGKSGNQSNTSDMLKSFFFEIDYNAMYNGTIVHSKDNVLGNLESVDNASQPLTILESDGVFQKEKVNRLGNSVYVITMKHNDFTEVQSVGTVLDQRHENAIVYRREVAFFENGIMATYFASADYVLRNYYTSVWSKHRTYNLMSYDESVRRSEVIKQIIYLSKDKLYFEKNNRVSDYFFYDQTKYELLFSAFKSSTMPKSINYLKKPNKINSAIITYGNVDYLTDVNLFVSGNSILFNLAMYDNVSNGIKVEDTENEQIAGFIQGWYFAIDDIETGETKNMSFKFAHYDSETILHDGVYITDTAYIKDQAYPRLFQMPKVYDGEITNVLEIVETEVQKDNKEQLDFTLQYEFISDDKDIFFTEWLPKLSDLSAVFQKNNSTYLVKDVQGEYVPFDYFYYTRATGSYEAQTRLVFRIGDDFLDLMTTGRVLEMNTIFFESGDGLEQFFLTPKEIIGENQIPNTANHNVTIRCKASFQTRYSVNGQGGSGKWLVFEGEMIIALIKQNPESEVLEGFKHYNMVRVGTLADEGFYYTNASFVKAIMGSDFYGVDLRSLHTARYDIGQQYDIAFDDLSNINSQSDEGGLIQQPTADNLKTELYGKNMYLFKTTEKMNKSMLKLELKPEQMAGFGYELFEQDVPIASIFEFKEEGAKKYIDVNIIGELEGYGSVQYWFLDARTGLLKLVFGININEEEVQSIRVETEQGLKTFKFVRVYVSEIENDFQEVYSNTGQVFGKSKNLKDYEGENYGMMQMYDIVED